MLNVKAEIKSWLLKGILVGIGALLVLLLKETLYLILDLFPIITKEMLDTIQKTKLLYISSLSLLLNLITSTCLFYLMFFDNKFKFDEIISNYGIKFDYLSRPLCPVCDCPLQVEKIQFKEQITIKPKLFCPKDIKHYNRIPTDLLGEEKHISIIVNELFHKPKTIKTTS